ncbi:MAG: hypothetical protein ABI333_10025 [bacterium]
MSASLGLLVLWPRTATAETITDPRSLALGGSLRAAPTGASALFLNPAGMALVRSYQITAFYDFHIRKNGHVAHSSVVDSVASKWVCAGLYYNLLIMRPDVFERGQQKKLSLKQDGHETGIALAVPLGSRFSIGATVKYIYYKARVDMPGAEGEGSTEHTVDKISNVGMDVGILVRITEGLSVGVTGMNLVPQKSIYSPMSMGMGVAYGYKSTFLAAFDVLLDFSSKESVTVDIHGGAELFLGGKYAIRVGTMHKGLLGATYLTAGFGYINPKAGVDIFLVQQVDRGVETRIGFGIKLFVK